MSTSGNVFKRAGAGMNLTPSERAMLKALQGLLITFAAAAAPIVAAAVQSALSGGTMTIDWRGVLDNALKAGLVSVFFVTTKYVGALKDTPLPEPVPVAAPVPGLPEPVPVAALPEGHVAVRDLQTQQLYAVPAAALPGNVGENGTNEPHVTGESVNLVTTPQSLAPAPTEGEASS